ncbi:MAG: hypothetical protein AVDCRST_MAG89-4947, partial [uncultured Gemmatimonadetes bacterium]
VSEALLLRPCRGGASRVRPGRRDRPPPRHLALRPRLARPASPQLHRPLAPLHPPRNRLARARHPRAAGARAPSAPGRALLAPRAARSRGGAAEQL